MPGIAICNSPILTCGAPPWTPAALASKQVLWLRSRDVVLAGADVTQANDSSGRGHHAVSAGAPPSIVANYVNGHPAVYHDSTPEYLSVASHADFNLTGDLTFYMVARGDAVAVPAFRWALLTRTGAGNQRPWDMYGTGLTTNPNMLSIRSTNISSEPLSLATWHRVGFRCSGAVGKAITDGVWGADVALGEAFPTAAVPLLIGTRDDSFTKHKGHWTEIFVFNAALTDDEMGKLDAWAKAEYAL